MSIDAIQSTLQAYFDVMYDCDLARFDAVFHPACSLFTAGGASLVVRPFAQYREEMKARTPPRSLGQSRALETIVKIDLLSPDIALAQVRVQIHDTLFADNLNLVLVGERWMVVAKVYHAIGPAVH